MGVVNPTIVVAMPSVDGSRFLAIREVSSFFIRRFVGDGLLKHLSHNHVPISILRQVFQGLAGSTIPWKSGYKSTNNTSKTDSNHYGRYIKHFITGSSELRTCTRLAISKMGPTTLMSTSSTCSRASAVMAG